MQDLHSENQEAALTGGGKQANRPLGRWKCTPSAYGTSPGGGGLFSIQLLFS